jgi:hypothetical protein
MTVPVLTLMVLIVAFGIGWWPTLSTGAGDLGCVPSCRGQRRMISVGQRRCRGDRASRRGVSG